MELSRWQQLITVLTHLESDQAGQVLDLLLSLDEKEAIGSRLAVFKALLEGKLSQRQMAAELNVSIATITRCSNNLKAMSPEQRERLTSLLFG